MVEEAKGSRFGKAAAPTTALAWRCSCRRRTWEVSVSLFLIPQANFRPVDQEEIRGRGVHVRYLLGGSGGQDALITFYEECCFCLFSG